MRAIASASSGTAGLARTALSRPLRRRAAPATVDDRSPVVAPLLAPPERTPAHRTDLLGQVPLLHAPHAAILGGQTGARRAELHTRRAPVRDLPRGSGDRRLAVLGGAADAVPVRRSRPAGLTLAPAGPVLVRACEG